jgi:alkanesulfonate monooxygenase SsuD/methylene tetrahydromethanopterin reductase-like flavin-dependent oxidoreductase (luciferase family)
VTYAATSLELSVFPQGEGRTLEELTALWQLADRLGYHSIWHEDNLFPHAEELVDRTVGMLDCWTAITLLSQRTERIRFGPMVMPAPRRHPALLAKAVATLDHACGGRLTIGIGAGDPTTADSYAQWGLPFPATPAERLQIVSEHLEVQRILYTAEVGEFSGEHYALHNAVCSPKPFQQPHPPMWLGMSTRARVMPKVAARLAQGVVIEWGDDAVAAQVVPTLYDACDELGRDAATITRARHLGCIVTADPMTPESAYARYAELAGVPDAHGFRSMWETWLGGFVGTPDQIASELRRRTIDLGFDHVMLTVVGLGFDRDDESHGLAGLERSGIRAVAGHVVPAMRDVVTGWPA